MTTALKLPVGIEDFREIRRLGFYYIDKTNLIEQFLRNWGKVNLFTRPRRFGKTLNMSMLRCFFEIGTDKTLFDHLYISEKRQLCEEYMGKFPVIFLTLKGVEGESFQKAKSKLIRLVALEAERFPFLKDSDRLTENEKERYRALIQMQDGKYSMEEDILESALQTLSELLYRYYGQKAIILIDEYDVPLDKAYQNGYYREMVSLIRSLFGDALKTNEFLQFAILTGCLRVSMWSVLFTTGYLTQVGMTKQGAYKLTIPNKEVREVYKLQIQEWFEKEIHSNTESLAAFWKSVEEGNTEAIEQYLNRTLSDSISVFDTKAPDKEKENSYHTLLIGLLTENEDWVVRSNVEAGEGFADIIIEPEDPDMGIVFELKCARTAAGLESACERAVAQIKSRRYAEYLKNDGRQNVILYGIAFYKKRCLVIVEKVK